MGEITDSASDAALPSVLEMDHVFEVLSHPRRRYLLYTLGTNGKRPLWELARHIAAWEDDVPEGAVSEDAVERVYVSLYHNHVPKLAGQGVIAFSEAEETIQPGGNADDVMNVLGEIGGYNDSKQENHAREEHGEGYS